MSAVAVLCIHCGYNVKTGRNTTVAAPDEDEDEAPKRRRKPSSSRLKQFIVTRITSWKLWSGLGMMSLAAIWLLVTRWAIQEDGASFRTGRSCIYMLILFVAGGISFINGLFDGDNA